MNAGAQSWLLTDGHRLHLQHGPMDLIVSADGPQAAITQAYQRARETFEQILSGLVSELAMLRCDLSQEDNKYCQPQGPVARRMVYATRYYAALGFITPMAAVAGAVADYVLAALSRQPSIVRACVNNGGDMALYLGPGSHYRIGVCTNPETASQPATVTVHAHDRIGGIATSGWRGRSHSLGIADAVTVLAHNAAAADAAATFIANAVNLPADSNCVERTPACTLTPDTDLGKRLVTVAVKPLDSEQRNQALSGGFQLASQLLQADEILGCYLNVQDEVRSVGSGQIISGPSS